MNCHECARTGRSAAAVSACRFCPVGLCKDHLVASFNGAKVPQDGCEHHPEQAFHAVARDGDRTLTAVSAR